MIGVQQEIGELVYSNITTTIPIWNLDTLTAGAFVVGTSYKIVSIGTTNFMLIGASANTVGLVFTATGVGSGTGTAQTTYLIEEFVRVGTKVYRSSSTLNIGNYPPDTLGVFWVYWSPSNAHAAFDLLQDTTTTWSANGIFTFARGAKEVIGLGQYVATDVTIEYLDSGGTVLDTETIHSFNSPYITGWWTYIYSGFELGQGRVIYRTLKKLGVNVRITLSNAGAATSLGYCVAGKATYFGDTEDNVSFPDKRIGSQSISVANFTTSLAQDQVMFKTHLAKSLINTPMMFIIDPTNGSPWQNLVIIGKIMKCDPTPSTWSQNKIAWEIEQNIEV